MRIVLRADAGVERGTGHVMRCLTLGEGLLEAGHDVVLVGDLGGVEWLLRQVGAMGIRHIACPRDSHDQELFVELGADRVVVDSYWIPAELISSADARVPTLAIVDGDHRGISAHWYLDHNVGAEERDWSHLEGTVLAGARYGLVRKAVAALRRQDGWKLPGRESRIVAFMGGTDPRHVMTAVVRSIAAVMPEAHLTAVTTTAQLEGVSSAAARMPNAEIVGPTSSLPEMLGSADVIVSAAGTSLLDVCALGRAALFVGVVDNQRDGLAHAMAAGAAYGVDATLHGAESVGEMLVRLLDDEDLRRSTVERALELVDGRGVSRVVRALTA